MRPRLSFTRQKGDSFNNPRRSQYEQKTFNTTIFRRIEAGA
jgi:hypothetical protein